MIGKPPGKPIVVDVDNVMEKEGMVNPQQVVQQQVTDMFKNANFFGDF